MQQISNFVDAKDICTKEIYWFIWNIYPEFEYHQLNSELFLIFSLKQKSVIIMYLLNRTPSAARAFHIYLHLYRK